MDEGNNLVLDVRPPEEFSSGHIGRAENLPLENLSKGMARLPKVKSIVVYDRLSSRSKAASEKLMQAGFKVNELAGGLASWLKHQYPLEVN